MILVGEAIVALDVVVGHCVADYRLGRITALPRSLVGGESKLKPIYFPRLFRASCDFNVCFALLGALCGGGRCCCGVFDDGGARSKPSAGALCDTNFIWSIYAH